MIEVNKLIEYIKKEENKFEYSYDYMSGLMIGNGSFKFCIPVSILGHEYGGKQVFKIIESEDGILPNEYESWNGWKRLGDIEGDSIHIYDSDCLDPKEWNDHILVTLKGSYSIYYKDGVILFFT